MGQCQAGPGGNDSEFANEVAETALADPRVQRRLREEAEKQVRARVSDPNENAFERDLERVARESQGTRTGNGASNAGTYDDSWAAEDYSQINAADYNSAGIGMAVARDHEKASKLMFMHAPITYRTSVVIPFD